jgi:hypothetical protein
MPNQTGATGRQLVEPGQPAAPRHEGPGFVGSWQVTFFEVEGPPTRALATFGADGTVVTAEHPVVTPPVATGPIFTSAGHGAWRAVGPVAAVFTIIGLGSYGQGSLFGTATGRGRVTLGGDGRTLGGEVVWTVADAEGNSLATFAGSFQATRIVAEGPPDSDRSVPAPAGDGERRAGA